MIAADFFSRTGLFVVPNFLSCETCDKLRAVFASAEWKPATVAQGGQDAYDLKYRKAKRHVVDENSKNGLHSRLLTIRPQLETRFGVALSGCRAPVFLSYSVGDFFKPHEDTSDDPGL